MLFTYRRVGGIPLLSALVAAAALAFVAGVAAIALVVVAVAACGVWLLRVMGVAGPAGRARAVADPNTIEGVVVDSTDLPLSNTEQLSRAADDIVVPRPGEALSRGVR